MPTVTYHQRLLHALLLYVLRGFAIALCLTSSALLAANAAPSTSKPDAARELHKGTFLVATQNLAGSSFQETVILITHYNKQGTTGIAINRPSTVTMKEAYPEEKRFKDGKDELYLGGPVRPDTIFVLMKSSRPHEDMQRIADDVYFSPGISAMIHSKDDSIKGEATRAYAGYIGWAPGQLEVEIHRGDWLVIQADMSIIFSTKSKSVWQTLHKAWSGTWL